MPSNESDVATAKIKQIGDAIAEQVDLDKLLALSKKPPLNFPHKASVSPLPCGDKVRIGIARDVGSGVQDNNFTVTGAKTLGNDINIPELIDLCLSENTRRMSGYDRRLLRPFAMPALARLARRFMRSRKANAGATAA